MTAPPAGVVLLPEALKAAGYYTALCGKHHLIPDRSAHPTGHPEVGHGFDFFFGFYGGASGYWASGRQGKGWQRNGEAFVDDGGYTTDIISREAVRVISSRSSALAGSAPLFLWVSWTAPHRPLEADPRVEAYDLGPLELCHTQSSIAH